MNRILNFEFYKLTKQKYWIICFLFGLLLEVISIYSIYYVTKIDYDEGISTQSFTLDSIKYNLFFNSNIVIAIFIYIYTCIDFSDKIIKNYITKDLTRESIVTAKMLVAIIIGVIYIIIKFLLGLVFFYFLNSNISIDDIKNIQPFSLFFLSLLQYAVYVVVFSFFAYLIRNVVITILFNFILISIVPLVVGILAKNNNYEKIIYILPKEFLRINTNHFSYELYIYILSMLTYLFIFFISSIVAFKSRDL